MTRPLQITFRHMRSRRDLETAVHEAVDMARRLLRDRPGVAREAAR